jgi:very-short-patch-repair endonuclease
VDEGDGPSSWRVPLADALLAVLVSEPRMVAIACCSAALQKALITTSGLERVFDRAPQRCRRWMPLVSELDESHGETDFRIRYRESGRACEQQITVDGIGRFDFRVSAHVYVEIDGGQHDPDWSGDGESSWEHDLVRDAAMAARGDRVLHFGYRQLSTAWPTIIAAIDRAVADDAALAARRRRHPYRPRVAQRKRRRFADIDPP